MMNGDKLEQIMRDKNVNVKDMYTRLGMSRSAFYRKCRGISEFKISEITKICEILGIDTGSEIFFGKEVS